MPRSNFQQKMRRFLENYGDRVGECEKPGYYFDGKRNGSLAVYHDDGTVSHAVDVGNHQHHMSARMAQSAAFAAIRNARSISDLRKALDRTEYPWFGCTTDFYYGPLDAAAEYVRRTNGRL